MQMIEHRMDIQLKKDDFDETGKLRAGAILSFFQDAAAQHADLLGVGFDRMIANGRIWIITKLRFRVEKDVEPTGNYYVRTWPRQKKSRSCPRDYYLYSQQGELMVAGTTLWSIIDFKSRRLERIDFEYDGILCDKEAFEDGIPRLHMQNLEPAGSYTIEESDLDVNDHTNNCRYADLVCGTSEIEKIEELSIQFSKETRLGDKIQLFREAVPGGELICGKRVSAGETAGGDPLRTKDEAGKAERADSNGQLVFLAKVVGKRREETPENAESAENGRMR